MIPDLSDEDRQLLKSLEEDLWREETRFDTIFMERVLAMDFFEIGRSGRVYQREAILAAPGRNLDAVIPLPDF